MSTRDTNPPPARENKFCLASPNIWTWTLLRVTLLACFLRFVGNWGTPCSEPYLILIFRNRKKFYGPRYICTHPFLASTLQWDCTFHLWHNSHKTKWNFNASRRFDIRPINAERNCYISRFKSSRRVRNYTDSFLQLLENNCSNRRNFFPPLDASIWTRVRYSWHGTYWRQVVVKDGWRSIKSRQF